MNYNLAPDGEPFPALVSDPGAMAQARRIAERLHGTTGEPEDVAEELGIEFTVTVGQHLDHTAWRCADCGYWCLPSELRNELCHGCR